MIESIITPFYYGPYTFFYSFPDLFYLLGVHFIPCQPWCLNLFVACRVVCARVFDTCFRLPGRIDARLLCLFPPFYLTKVTLAFVALSGPSLCLSTRSSLVSVHVRYIALLKETIHALSYTLDLSSRRLDLLARIIWIRVVPRTWLSTRAFSRPPPPPLQGRERAKYQNCQSLLFSLGRIASISQWCDFLF